MAQEIALWRGVIRRALADATRNLDRMPRSRERQRLSDIRAEARAWLTGGGEDFHEVCMLASIDGAKLRRSVEQLWPDAPSTPRRRPTPPNRKNMRKPILIGKKKEKYNFTDAT